MKRALPARAAVLAALLFMFTADPSAAASEKRLDGGPKPIVVRPGGPVVTIDVKDAEVVVILKEMQKQCGIRNLMIDPNVQGKGTFYFHDVPCAQAWRVVLRSLGLDSVTYSSSVVTVGKLRD